MTQKLTDKNQTTTEFLKNESNFSGLRRNENWKNDQMSKVYFYIQ